MSQSCTITATRHAAHIFRRLVGLNPIAVVEEANRARIYGLTLAISIHQFPQLSLSLDLEVDFVSILLRREQSRQVNSKVNQQPLPPSPPMLHRQHT